MHSVTITLNWIVIVSVIIWGAFVIPLIVSVIKGEIAFEEAYVILLGLGTVYFVGWFTALSLNGG